jgi:hypothetical protein
MFKQVCFFRKRPDMTMEEFIAFNVMQRKHEWTPAFR